MSAKRSPGTVQRREPLRNLKGGANAERVGENVT